MATPDAVFVDGLDFFSTLVDQVGPDDWGRPSPCAGWRVLDVLGHVGAAVRFGTVLLRTGEATWKPFEPPGAAVDADPPEWWRTIAGPARDIVSQTDLSRVVEAPRGPRSVAEGLSFPALDLFVHAWDLGRAVGVDVVIPPEVIAFGHALLDDMPAGQVRSPAVFADEVPAPLEASASDGFIAWTGRNPHWCPA